MHEFSIVQSLLTMCEKNAADNNAKKVTKIEVKIGKLSGVEPHLLQTAFDTFKEKTICDGAEFCIHVQELVVKCHECGKQSELDKNTFACPHCEGAVEVLDGEEMYLMRLEME